MFKFKIRTMRCYITGGFVLLTFILAMICLPDNKQNNDDFLTETTVEETTAPASHKISGVPIIAQNELRAACETYACTMLLNYYNFSIDEFEFAQNYLITYPVTYGEDGNLYGPDMNAAFAGDVYTGWGVNAPAMAKSMNKYLETQKTDKRAQALSNVKLDDICKNYIDNDIPAMVWVTTYMQEPYVKSTWIVDYVDENSKVKIGDTVSWLQNEHCMVLVGYDEDNYYFNDSVAEKVTVAKKAVAEERYSQVGKQAIVLQ